MKKYVFTIKDDICAANGKDIEASELIAKMRLWGDVEDYENVVASVRAEYQSVVDNLTKQLTVIKSQELTEDEIALLNSYRSCKKVNGDKYQARIDALENQLENIRVDHQKKITQITELLTQ
jgi:RPA family protein